MNINTLKALVLREYWEHRGLLFRTPLTISIILVVLATIGTYQAVKFAPWKSENGSFHYEHHDGSSIKIKPDKKFGFDIKDEIGKYASNDKKGRAKIQIKIIGTVLLVSSFFGALLSLFYLSQSLYQDRKDRSILFWRSLPNSEWATITSKLLTGMFAFPIIFSGFAVITAVACLIIIYIGSLFLGISPLLEMVVAEINLYAIKTLFTIIAAILVLICSLLPIYTWFLFSSSFSKKSPLLIAVGIPIGIFIAEGVLLHSNHLASTLLEFVSRLGANIKYLLDGEISAIQWHVYFAGVLIAAAFLFATHWLRNNRYEI